MGKKSVTEMLLRRDHKHSKNNTQSTADSQSMKKYLYNLSTAKYMKGYELLYREKEYFFWFMSNINYLIQFYTLWRREPVELLTGNRQTWYEWTEDKVDVQMVHAPVAPFITTMMRDLVFSGPVEIKINGQKRLNDRLQKAFAENENDIQNFLRKADMMESVGGTILIKANYDKNISQYPILEYYEVDKIDYMERFGRFTSMITVDNFIKDSQEYTLIAEHTRKGIEYKLYQDGNQVEMSKAFSEDNKPIGLSYGVTIDEEGNATQNLGPILAVWKQRHLMSKEFYDMKLGASDYEGHIDSFQMLDEIYSRFINQIRATQPVLFMSEELMGYSKDHFGEIVINKPKDLGVKIYELSGGLSNIDGKSIAAMFNRDVPELTGVTELSSAFEWVLRQILTLSFVAPSTGNIDTEKIGSNTTGSSLFKREQSTHLLRKQMIESWQTTIEGIVRLMCQWFDIIDGKTIPDNYDDLNIDVNFPEIDLDDFDSRLNQAISGFVAGLFDIKSGVRHAFKGKLSETDIDELIKSLEKQREERLAAAKAKTDSSTENKTQNADVLAKVAKNKKESEK